MYMYNMKSISGVRGWAGIALDALESQDIYDLFGNKRKKRKSLSNHLCTRLLPKIKIVNSCTIANLSYLMGSYSQSKTQSSRN